MYIRRTGIYIFILILILSSGSKSLARFSNAISSRDNVFVMQENIEVSQGFISFNENNKNTDYTIVPFNLTYGVWENYEITMQIPFIFFDHGSNGIGDILLLQRYQFMNEEENKANLTLGLGLDIPTGSKNKGLGTGKLDILFTSSLSKAINNYVVLGNLEYQIQNDNFTKDIFRYNFAGTYLLQEKLKLCLELNGQTSNRDFMFISPGIIYEPKKDFNIMFNLQFGINNESPDSILNLRINHEF